MTCIAESTAEMHGSKINQKAGCFFTFSPPFFASLLEQV